MAAEKKALLSNTVFVTQPLLDLSVTWNRTPFRVRSIDLRVFTDLWSFQYSKKSLRHSSVEALAYCKTEAVSFPFGIDERIFMNTSGNLSADRIAGHPGW